MIKRSGRIEWLDIAKGIGICCVFLGHTIFTDKLWRVWVYAFHMPLFFFLSGITYNEDKYKKIKDLISSKVKSIWIPYIILCAVQLVYYFGTSVYGVLCKQGEISFDTLLKKIVGVLLGVRETPWYCAYWFLLCICIVYIFMYFLTNLRKTANTTLWISIALLCIGLLYGKMRLPYLPWSLDVAMVATFFSVLGWIVKQIIAQSIKYRFMWIAAIGSVVFCMLNFHCSGVSIDMYSSRYGCSLLFVLSAILGSLFVIAVSQRIKDNYGILTHLGKNSLFYYGVNVLALKVVNILTLGVLDRTANNGFLTFVMCVMKAVIAIALSRIFLPYFDRTRDFVSKLIRKELIQYDRIR